MYLTDEDPSPLNGSSLSLSHSGNKAFAAALERVANGYELLAALGRYVHFNSNFGCGVAHLAGQLGVRRDLFRDRAEPVEALADRSSEVASYIFFAAIDEFGERSLSSRGT